MGCLFAIKVMNLTFDYSKIYFIKEINSNSTPLLAYRKTSNSVPGVITKVRLFLMHIITSLIKSYINLEIKRTFYNYHGCTVRGFTVNLIIFILRKNSSWATSCNFIGQNAGGMVGLVFFLILNSRKFCNSYIRAYLDLPEQDYGFMNLDSNLIFFQID